MVRPNPVVDMRPGFAPGEQDPSGQSAVKPRLEAVDLECVRDECVLFSGLGFELHSGQALMVEGANGTGKTTLLRAICGLVRPESGVIRWCGADITDVRFEYQADLAYLAHAHGIKEELTPLENLRVSQALAGGRNGRDPLETLGAVGMGSCADTAVRALSAGQRRRVAIARLLLSNARLWILDEPFTALDQGGIQMVERFLEEHCAGGGIALVSSHHPLSLGCSTDTPIRLSP